MRCRCFSNGEDLPLRLAIRERPESAADSLDSALEPTSLYSALVSVSATAGALALHHLRWFDK